MAVICYAPELRRSDGHTIFMDMFTAKTLTPMLFHKRVEAFNDPEYLFELKLDGVRCLAYLDEHGTELRTKENRPLLNRFPEMSEIHRGIKNGASWTVNFLSCAMDARILRPSSRGSSYQKNRE